MEVPGGALQRLAALRPKLERPGLNFGKWAGGERNPDGSITMPYYDFSPEALELLQGLPVVPFDWPTWMAAEEAQRLIGNHDEIAAATAEQLIKLTTAIVRSNRFTDGSLAGAFESGLLAAIARRAEVLTAQPTE